MQRVIELASPTYLIGDLHGHYDVYQRLLVSSGLCNESLDWTGDDARLWLIGDFFDRGPAGIKCVELTMKLQTQAEASGGYVNSLLGNHEMMILCACLFSDDPKGKEIHETWLRWGGVETDYTELTSAQIDWLLQLPAMATTDKALLIHADAMLYVDHGLTVDQVNRSFADLMSSRNLDKWLRTLSAFSEHMAFASPAMTGQKRAEQFLSLYGGDLIVHGHTPIPMAKDVPGESVNEAWLYADGRCLNVDGGIYMGSPGFTHAL